VLVTIFTILFVLICPFLIFLVLVQDPKGGGLAGVLGGAGGGSAFGAKTADVVVKVTIALGIVFFALALTLGFALKSETAAVPSIAQQTPLSKEAPLTSGAATAPIAPAPEAPAPSAPAAPATAAPASAAPAAAPADAPAAAPAPQGETGK
jgi:preprotein translocase subunit SecG